MIPIKDAISNGNWLHCEVFLGAKIRMKVLSFQKLNLLEVDDPEKIDFIAENKILWIMDIEVVSFSKSPISTVEMNGQLFLINQNGIKFQVYRDIHLGYNSEFSKKKRLRRFCGETLNPKIKAIGAILFQLPDDIEAEYSISIRRGSIKEV